MVRDFAVLRRPIFTDVAVKADTEYPTLQRRYLISAKERRRENTQRQWFTSKGFSLRLCAFVRNSFALTLVRVGKAVKFGSHEGTKTRRRGKRATGAMSSLSRQLAGAKLCYRIGVLFTVEASNIDRNVHASSLRLSVPSNYSVRIRGEIA